MQITREEWLTEAAKRIEQELLSQENVSMPEKWAVAVGFPFRSKNAIGQAWSPENCADHATGHILISPTLGKSDPVNLLAVLLHEQIHQAVGIKEKHGGEFKRVARNLGLEGRLTATYVSPGTSLYTSLAGIHEELVSQFGEYPHEQIIPTLKPVKKRNNNFVVYVSTENPEYKVKIKKDLVESFGVPRDFEGVEMEIEEE